MDTDEIVKDETAGAVEVEVEPARSRSRSRSAARSKSPEESRRREKSYSRSRSRSRSPRRDARGPKFASNFDRDRRERDRYAERGGNDRGSRDYDRDRRSGGGGGGGGGFGASREIAANEAAKRSQKDCRVYVGNLAFGVRWNDLKDFMRDAGHVVFSEVMTLPDGRSKGCGVVEFSSPQEAQRAIRDLNDQTLMGRPLFIREDRENEARYGAASVFESGRGARGGRGGRGGYAGVGDRGGVHRDAGRALVVQGLNNEVGWQDLKDLFRQAGSIIRADVKLDENGITTGVGSVVFNTVGDAQNAISMFHGAELNGMKLDVREERFGSGGSASNGPFGIPRSGPFAPGGSGHGSHHSSGRSDRDDRGHHGMYDDYHPSAPMAVQSYDPGMSSRGGASSFPNAQPSPQIFVKNLPWSTTNDDLVELFQTTGTVQYAEVLWEGGRSKGVGIIQFASQEEAETAIQKFQLYNYGGRNLSLEFNGRWRDFTLQPVIDHDAIAAQNGGGGERY